MKDIKILIAAHKECLLPKEDIFFPVQVGKRLSETKLDIQGDDEGDNISHKNPNYCELTAIYWAWKNLNADIIGLCHYRRYFKFDTRKIFVKELYQIETDKLEKLRVSRSRIEKYMLRYDIILAKPAVYSHSLEFDYKSACISEDLDIVETVLKKKYPLYSFSWDKVMKMNNKLSHYNMFICNNDLFNKYCEWLFDILFEAEKTIKLSPYLYQQRVFGFLSERLLQIYCKHNKLKIKTLPIYFLNDNLNNRSIVYLYLRNLKNGISFYSGNPKAIFSNQK